jgi:hypothetical protein
MTDSAALNQGSGTQSVIRDIGKPEFVMAGLVPAIHVLLLLGTKDVDARHKAGMTNAID